MRNLSDIIFNRDPLTLPLTESVKEACRRMHAKPVGSVLVIDDEGHLAGIFTGRDVVHRVVAKGRSAKSTRLVDVMTEDPVVMKPDQSAIEALRLMWDGGFRHVPVVDGNRLLGVVSRGDFNGEEKERLEQERELWEHMR